MAFIPAEFHFLRPMWFLGAVPAVLLFWALRRKKADGSGWAAVVDRSLLPYLLDGESTGRRGWLWYVLLAGWLAALLAVAGPTWQKLPMPVEKKADALVIIQDLSLSMLAADLRPNRLTRVQHKIIDLLDSRREGTTGLVVYSGDAHVVAPLTDDTNTIAAMVPDLSPAIMPAYGSDLVDAVSLALQLLTDGAAGSGRLLLITDEVEKMQSARVAKLLAGKDVSLSVLGVGSVDGAPIPKGDGGFLTDDQGKIVVPRLDRESLVRLAGSNGGRYNDIRLDDKDIEYLLADQTLSQKDDQYRKVEREFDQWREEGYWLVLAILPLALLAFRRGWLIGLTIILLLPAAEAKAFEWQDLWLRKDQQAARALEHKKPKEAAELFDNPQWKGVAEYRAGDYGEAVKNFESLAGADGDYNRGNALARQGRIGEAIKAYEGALKKDPGHADARFNKELLEKLQGQQSQQGGDGQDQKDQSSEDQQGGQGDQDQAQQGEKSDQSQGQQGDDQNREGQSGKNQSGESPENKVSKEQGDEKGVREEGDRDDQKQSEAETAKKEEQKDGESPEKAGEKADQTGDSSESQDESGSLSAEERQEIEKQQVIEQWLRRIPDNPGGLLKRKFEYQYRRNGQRNSGDNQKVW